MVVLDDQYVNEEDSTNAITIANTEQSIPIPIIEEPNMTTRLSENVPESSLPTTVPVTTGPLLSNENDDNCSSIASNNTVNDTSVKVYTESEMQELDEMWLSIVRQEKSQHLLTIKNLIEESNQTLNKCKEESNQTLNKCKEESKKRESELENHINELRQNIVTMKHNFIRNIYCKQKFGKEELEMLVITLIKKKKRGTTGHTITPQYQMNYYGFRRQLNSMLKAVKEKINTSKGDRVELWFVSYNAVQDFIKCKSYIDQKAKENGIELKMKGNDIGANLNSTNFDIVESIRDFGESEGMIELNKNFLQTVIEISKNHRRTKNDQARVEQLKNYVKEESDEMLKDIYNYIMKNLN